MTATDTAPDPDTVDDDAFWERIANLIFARRYDDGWSLRRIAEETAEAGYAVSSETIRKFLDGDTRPELTERLRFVYADRTVGPPILDADGLEDVFDAFHNQRRSLSAIARDLGPGYDYSHVRRILVGEGPYDEPTEELRRRYPPYAPRDGRSHRLPFTEADIARAFRLYFKELGSLNDVREQTGIPRERFRALV